MWAKSAPHGWDRVKVSENLGATAVVPDTLVDTSLYIIAIYAKFSSILTVSGKKFKHLELSSFMKEKTFIIFMKIFSLSKKHIMGMFSKNIKKIWDVPKISRILFG